MHGLGDGGVSAHQFGCLVAGARLVEQGRDDRGDVGAGDCAGRDRRGGESDPQITGEEATATPEGPRSAGTV